MKKLLGILGSISLIATSGMVVVSCGNSDNTNVDDSDAINKLINQFNAEVTSQFNQLVRDPMIKNANVLSDDDSNMMYSFYKKENLKNIYEDSGVSSGKTTFYHLLNPTNENNFKTQTNEILSPTTKINELRSALNISIYQVILGDLGNNWIEDLTFDWENAQLEYSDLEIEGSETNDEWIANIQLGYKTIYKYYDAEEQLKETQIDGSIVLTISNDGVIIAAINDIYTEFAAKLLNDGNDLVYIDYDKLKNYNNDLTEVDLLAGTTNEYKTSLEQYYNAANGFADNVKDHMKDVYFTNADNPILNSIDLSFANDDIKFDEDASNNIGAMGVISRTEEFDNDESLSITNFRNLYYGTTRDDTTQTLGGEVKSVNQKLYSDLESGYSTTYANYHNSFTKDYNQMMKNSGIEIINDHSEEIGKSVSRELVTLSGLTLTIANNDYTQELSDLSFVISVAMDNSSTSIDEESISDSQIFKTYYNGTKNILDEFHTFYGIEELTDDEVNGFAKSKLLMKMTGNTGYIESGNEFNIWEYWYGLAGSDSPWDQQNVTTFRSALNLQNSVVARRAKADFITNKINGTNTFNIIYNEYQSGDRTFRLRNSAYTNSKFNEQMLPGISLQSSRNRGMGTGITTDIFSIQWNTQRNSSAWDHSSMGQYTYIGDIRK